MMKIHKIVVTPPPPRSPLKRPPSPPPVLPSCGTPPSASGLIPPSSAAAAGVSVGGADVDTRVGEGTKVAVGVSGVLVGSMVFSAAS